MKPIALPLIFLLCQSLFAQKIIPQYNIFFSKGQTEIGEKQQAILLAIIQKLHSGQRAFILPLETDSLRGELVFSAQAEMQANALLDLAKTENCEGVISRNFPCGYKGSAVGLRLTKTELKMVSQTHSLKDHYPEKPSQFFVINPFRDTVLYGLEGTILYAQAGAFLTKSKQIQVELKEFYALADLMKGGMHTASNGRMLETGGSIFLDAKEDGGKGKQATLDSQKGIKADFALGKDDPEMQLFIKDPRREELNWIQTRRRTTTFTRETVVYTDGNGKVISEAEALARIERINKWNEERKAEIKRDAEFAKQRKEREAFENKLTIQNLGFINCDKFPEEPMRVLQAKADERYTATYYVIYKEVRGLMAGNQVGNTVNFGSVPTNRPATLVAVAFDDKQAYFTRVELAPGQSLVPELKLQPVTESYVNQQLALLK
jgi:hypothetical protein